MAALRHHALPAALVAAAVAATVVTAGTSAARVVPPLPAGPGTTAVAAAAGGPADRVVVVSVDGLNPTAIRRLGRAELPTLYRLMRTGASTLNARTAYERTRTLPNHTGMMTGRRVRAAAGGHGVSFNNDSSQTTVHAAAGEYVSSVFDVVHDRGGSTALFAAKDKFALYDRTWNSENGGADAVGADDGRDKIDRFSYASDRRLVTRVVEELQSAPRDLTFVHLGGPDRTGHAKGYLTPAYSDAVVRADRQVGRLVRTIRRSGALSPGTVLILTSDHGGKGFSHEDARRRYNYTVPFMVWGAGVDSGADLYRLNPDYRNPGEGRPGYARSRQPIRNAAAANLALDLLGLPAVPASTVNAGQDLDVSGR